MEDEGYSFAVFFKREDRLVVRLMKDAWEADDVDQLAGSLARSQRKHLFEALLLFYTFKNLRLQFPHRCVHCGEQSALKWVRVEHGQMGGFFRAPYCREHAAMVVKTKWKSALAILLGSLIALAVSLCLYFGLNALDLSGLANTIRSLPLGTWIMKGFEAAYGWVVGLLLLGIVIASSYFFAWKLGALDAQPANAKDMPPDGSVFIKPYRQHFAILFADWYAVKDFVILNGDRVVTGHFARYGSTEKFHESIRYEHGIPVAQLFPNIGQIV